MNYLQELEDKGYCVIEDVLSEDEINIALGYFYDWLNSYDQIKKIHNKVSPHGIIKFFEVGHQKHAWYIRTQPKVQEVFKNIWNTDDLVVSYDGTCWIPKDLKKKDNIWTHTDQAPNSKGFKCCQGFVSLTENKEKTFRVYEGSHKLHEQYCTEKNLNSSQNWLLIDHEYLQKIKDTEKILHVKAGSLVIWDSRTFHQNQYGNIPEERIVQYVSFLPKINRTEKMKQKRQLYYDTKRTTSHWAYPIKVNGLQPHTFGNKDLNIEYDKLKTPELDNMINDIEKLI